MKVGLMPVCGAAILLTLAVAPAYAQTMKIAAQLNTNPEVISALLQAGDPSSKDTEAVTPLRKASE
jgi:hypothetical protein